ncbi:hypothetical protein ACFL96_10085, partial [Thermoproteota archaeon]
MKKYISIIGILVICFSFLIPLHADSIKHYGGLDVRYSVVQGQNTAFSLHEAVVGLEATFDSNISALLEICRGLGEETEIEAFLKFCFAPAPISLRCGIFPVPFGMENQQSFFERKTVTASLIR